MLNRLEQVAEDGTTEEYEYSPGGQRVWWERDAVEPRERYVFYGAGGARMEEFWPSVNGTVLEFASKGRDVRFAGRLLYQKGEQVFADRLGSVVHRWTSSSGRDPEYYPYGGQRTGGVAEDRTGFGTYTRSVLTGLYYDRQRWNSGGVTGGF